MNSLEANGSVRVDGCLFQTIDLQDLLKQAIAAIPLIGAELVPSPTPDALNAGDLSSSFAIERGVVKAPDLKVQLSNATLEGKLSVGFDKSLGGTLSVVFLQDTFRLFGFGFEKLGNFLAREGRIAIPLLLGRTLADPSVRPDLKAIAAAVPGVNFIESVADGVEEAGDEVVDELSPTP